MPHIIQISDAHLAPHTANFAENWAVLQRFLQENPADIVIDTGDVSVDGADQRSHLDYSKSMHDKLPCPWLAVPGNHDAGEDYPGAWQPVNTERRQRWLESMGPDYWAHDLAEWRLIGLNSLIMGSGMAADAEQAAWLADIVNESAGRRLAVFLHKPFFLEQAPKASHADKATYTAWTVSLKGREDYTFLLNHPALRLVSSGHLHSHRVQRMGNVDHVWAPSLSFRFVDNLQSAIPATPSVGMLSIALGEEQAIVRLLQPAGLSQAWTNEDIPKATATHVPQRLSTLLSP